MSESVNIENKEQSRQKPPLSVARIACEILAGTVIGFIITLPVVYVLVARSAGDCFGIGKLIGAATGFLIVPPLYTFAVVVGVYLVGNRGYQTGSFLATLVGGLLGVPVTALLYIDIDMVGDMMLGIAKIVLWTLVFLAVPIIATICFNLTRRYKMPKQPVR
jgi:hypothetical protein